MLVPVALFCLIYCSLAIITPGQAFNLSLPAFHRPPLSFPFIDFSSLISPCACQHHLMLFSPPPKKIACLNFSPHQRLCFLVGTIPTGLSLLFGRSPPCSWLFFRPVFHMELTNRNFHPSCCKEMVLLLQASAKPRSLAGRHPAQHLCWQPGGKEGPPRGRCHQVSAPTKGRGWCSQGLFVPAVSPVLTKCTLSWRGLGCPPPSCPSGLKLVPVCI